MTITSFDCVKLNEFSVSSTIIVAEPTSLGSFGRSTIAGSVTSMIYNRKTPIKKLNILYKPIISLCSQMSAFHFQIDECTGFFFRKNVTLYSSKASIHRVCLIHSEAD
jgi:hypothetical protein